jgi:DNA-binding transcriptional LysR family regulator
VTQPAFSRRIQALEGWAGTDLVDRSSYPTRLTPAGQTLYAQAIEMLQGLQSTRAMLRGHSAVAQDVIEFAVPHTLAFTFFPAWVTSLQGPFGQIKSRLIALNVHDAVMRLVEGSCDLLIAYHHASQPLQLDANRYEMVSLGEEVVAPWVKPDAEGAPRYRLPGRPGRPLPYLGYAPGAYLSRLVDQLLKDSDTAIHLDRVYETDMAEGLKVMALEGHGIAFLPQSAVRREVRARKLVSALPPEMDKLESTMEIRAYRERPGAVPSAKPAGRSAKGPAGDTQEPKRAADALWSYLVGSQPAGRLDHFAAPHKL